MSVGPKNLRWEAAVNLNPMYLACTADGQQNSGSFPQSGDEGAWGLGRILASEFAEKQGARLEDAFDTFAKAELEV